jgi:hypothetical protein
MAPVLKAVPEVPTEPVQALPAPPLALQAVAEAVLQLSAVDWPT